MRFPSIAVVAKGLRVINAETRRLNGKGDCDVRLQVYKSGSGWALRWGLSDYDQDHRGYWGSSSVPGGRFDSRSIARELIRQVKEQAADDKG